MVEQNRDSNEKSRSSSPDLFSIDLLHLSSLMVLDFRPGIDRGLLALFDKRKTLEADFLHLINESAQVGEISDEMLADYGNKIFRVLSSIRSAPFGMGIISVTIRPGPLSSFFRTERWGELKQQFGHRVNNREIGRLFSQLAVEEKAAFKQNLILGNKLAGVLTLGSPGFYDQSLEIPSGEQDKCTFDN